MNIYFSVHWDAPGMLEFVHSDSSREVHRFAAKIVCAYKIQLLWRFAEVKAKVLKWLYIPIPSQFLVGLEHGNCIFQSCYSIILDKSIGYLSGNCPFPLGLALIESMTFPLSHSRRLFFRCMHPSDYCTFIRSIFLLNLMMCNLCNFDFWLLHRRRLFFCWVLGVISVIHPLYLKYIQLFKWYCSRGSWSVRHCIGCIPQDSPPFWSLIAWFSVSHDLTDQTEATLKGRWYQEFLIVQWCSGWRDVW